MVFQLSRYLDELGRVQSIGYRILRANAEFCGLQTRPRFGFGATTITNIPKKWRPVTKLKLGMDDHLRVTFVAERSPAHKAGLKVGDRLMTVDGSPAPYGKGATSKLTRILKHHDARRGLRLDVARSRKVYRLTLKPELACSHPLIIDSGQDANAFTDGTVIVIQRGILRVASSDEELALIIGHELAHATQGHLDKKFQNEIAGVLGGLAIDVIASQIGIDTKGKFTKWGAKAGFQAYSQAFEKEADYVGMYYASRAGFDTRGVEIFWRKMADEHPGSIQYATTHPTTPERFLLIRETHNEIEEKRRNRDPVRPNLKVAKSR